MSIEAEADALAAKYPPKPHATCGVQRSGQRALIDALIARDLSAARVSEIIAIERGITIGYQTVYRHKNRVCSCAR